MATNWSFKWVDEFIHKRFPDEDGPDSVWGAMAKLLLSAAVVGTTDPMKLARFTGYPVEFVLAIVGNMRNNKRWIPDGYDASRWWPLSGELHDNEFTEDMEASLGSLWYPGAESDQSVDVIQVYCRCTAREDNAFRHGSRGQE